MHARFRCFDPFDTPGRVLDAARQMRLALEAMRVDRTPDGAYALHLALAAADPLRCRAFLDRVGRLIDLTLEDTGA